MFNYTVDKTNTNAKVKATAKADLTNLFLEFLKEKFGEENTGMVRTGTTTSSKNEIGVRIGTVEINGEQVDLVATINATIKEFETRSTAKKTYEAFDFEAARDAYESYLVEKDEKATETKRLKEEKIARDVAARKKKAEEDTCDDF